MIVSQCEKRRFLSAVSLYVCKSTHVKETMRSTIISLYTKTMAGLGCLPPSIEPDQVYYSFPSSTTQLLS